MVLIWNIIFRGSPLIRVVHLGSPWAGGQCFVHHPQILLALGKSWFTYFEFLIDHFTVVGLVTLPLNDSEARGDLVLIQTSLLLLCKLSCSYTN